MTAHPPIGARHPYPLVKVFEQYGRWWAQFNISTTDKAALATWPVNQCEEIHIMSDAKKATIMSNTEVLKVGDIVIFQGKPATIKKFGTGDKADQIQVMDDDDKVFWLPDPAKFAEKMNAADSRPALDSEIVYQQGDEWVSAKIIAHSDNVADRLQVKPFTGKARWINLSEIRTLTDITRYQTVRLGVLATLTAGDVEALRKQLFAMIPGQPGTLTHVIATKDEGTFGCTFGATREHLEDETLVHICRRDNAAEVIRLSDAVSRIAADMDTFRIDELTEKLHAAQDDFAAATDADLVQQLRDEIAELKADNGKLADINLKLMEKKNAPSPPAPIADRRIVTLVQDISTAEKRTAEDNELSRYLDDYETLHIDIETHNGGLHRIVTLKRAGRAAVSPAPATTAATIDAIGTLSSTPPTAVEPAAQWNSSVYATLTSPSPAYDNLPSFAQLEAQGMTPLEAVEYRTMLVARSLDDDIKAAQWAAIKGA